MRMCEVDDYMRHLTKAENYVVIMNKNGAGAKSKKEAR